jgi:hypothetical protein
MRPLFAEYRVHTCSDHFRVNWPWRHARLPLHPRRSIGIGIAEGNEICVERIGPVIRFDIGGRRNHRVAFSDARQWHIQDMGHGGTILVDGVALASFAPLGDGSLIQVADGLVFRFDMPKTTHTAWSTFSDEQRAALAELARYLRPPPQSRLEADRWWPRENLTAEQPVLTDGLLELGFTVDDAEVELAHFAAWHDERRSLRD